MAQRGTHAAADRSTAVDALRGLAALMVVFFHAHEINWNGVSPLWHAHRLHPDLNALLSYALSPIALGFAAVPLFFVISGYCIHRPNVMRLTANPDHRLDLKSYFTRRLWRIYPVLIVALLLTMALDSYTRTRFPDDYKLGDTSWGNFLINLFSFQNVAGPPFGTNGALWTLALELHFYFLYPILFAATRRLGPARTLGSVFALSFIAIVVLRVMHSDVRIFLPYWFTWVMGFFVAECECRRFRLHLRKWLPLIWPAAAAACLLGVRHELLLAEPFFAVIFGAAVLWSVRHPRHRIWASAPLRLLTFTGVFSYSLYATHVPFLVFLRSWLQNGAKSNYVAVPLLFTCFCAALGILTFWLVERWSLRVPQLRPGAVPVPVPPPAPVTTLPTKL